MDKNHYDYVKLSEIVEREIRPKETRGRKKKSDNPPDNTSRDNGPYLGWKINYQQTDEMKELPSHETIEKVFKDLDAARYCFQLERGEEKGRLHYEGIVVFHKPRKGSEIRERFASLCRPNYKGGCLHTRKAFSIKDSYIYCTKPGGLHRPRFYPPNAYFGRDLLTHFSTKYEWQDQVMKWATDPVPDHRTVYCIIDEEGKSGKSTLAKTLGYVHDACVVPLGLSAPQMKAALSRLGPKDLYIVDLPRNNKDYTMLYDTIEEIKRGMIISCFQGKYTSLYMSRPHIVCFANEVPPLKNLSLDMWALYRINRTTMGIDKLDTQHEWRMQRQKDTDGYADFTNI